MPQVRNFRDHAAHHRAGAQALPDVQEQGRSDDFATPRSCSKVPDGTRPTTPVRAAANPLTRRGINRAINPAINPAASPAASPRATAPTAPRARRRRRPRRTKALRQTRAADRPRPKRALRAKPRTDPAWFFSRPTWGVGLRGQDCLRKSRRRRKREGEIAALRARGLHLCNAAPEALAKNPPFDSSATHPSDGTPNALLQSRFLPRIAITPLWTTTKKPPLHAHRFAYGSRSC